MKDGDFIIKKIVMVCICLVFLVAHTFIIPSKKVEAEAITFTIAGTAVSATAVYVLGALAVGGLATAVGIEYGEEINAHARSVWDTASTTVKEGFATALATAENGYVSLSGSVKSWFQNAATQVVGSSFVQNVERGVVAKDISTGTSTLNGSSSSYFFSHEVNSANLGDYRVVVKTVNGLKVYSSVGITLYGSGNLSVYTFNANNSTTSLLSDLGINAKLGSGDFGNAILFNLRSKSDLQGVFDVVNSLGGNQIALMSTAAINNYYNNVLANINSVFGTGSLGLNLPSDNLYLPRTTSGQTLVRQPDGTIAYPSGDVYVGDVDYSLPNLKVLDVEGVRVPVIPMIDVPGYYVNVNTGQVITTIEGDIPIDTPFPPAVVVPPAEIPTPITPAKPDKATKKLNLMPLQMAGETLKTKFPFSIPFDFIGQFAVFDVSPQTPVISIDKPNFVRIGGKSIPLKFNIDFSMFDDLASAARWALIIAFDIGLILMIRRLMPE